MSKIRKALVAGIGAGVTAFVASFPDGVTFEEVGGIAGAVIAVGFATYAVKNRTDQI